MTSWAATSDEVRAWCSRTEAPVPVDVVAGWGVPEDVLAFGLFDDGRLIGYGEVWLDHEEAECELARLIVDPACRGRGVGARLTGLLVDRARTVYPTTFLRVVPDNGAARRCYASAGFTRVSADEEREWNAGQPAEYVWMTYAD